MHVPRCARRKQLQAGPNVIDGHWHQVICQRIGNQIIEIGRRLQLLDDEVDRRDHGDE